jgi:hypothetical protein
MKSIPESRSNIERTLVTYAIWLYIGFIGASALGAGLLSLLEGEAKWVSAAALAVSGGVVAAVSWRRGRALLARADRATAAIGTSPDRTHGPFPDSAARIRQIASSVVRQHGTAEVNLWDPAAFGQPISRTEIGLRSGRRAGLTPPEAKAARPSPA